MNDEKRIVGLAILGRWAEIGDSVPDDFADDDLAHLMRAALEANTRGELSPQLVLLEAIESDDAAGQRAAHYRQLIADCIWEATSS